MPQNSVPDLIKRARTANERGAFDEARKICHKVFEQDQGNVAGLSAYMTATKIVPNDPVFVRIETFARQTQLPDDLLSQLHFMLGKGYADLGQTQRAFTTLIKANALKHAKFDPAKLDGAADHLIATAQAAPKIALKPNAPRMVFVLGMPRSGTSLLAQALGAHPKVQNLGEQTALGFAMRDPKTGQVSPASFLKGLTHERLEGARNTYMQAIAPLSNGAPFVIDKMPENYWLACAIPKLFPDALIVHITRDRLATAWSCFRHDFKEGHDYSYNFQHCLAQYDLCKKLTTAWKQQHRQHWYTLALSRLSRDPQREITVILKKLGLDWDAACLRPQDDTNSVATLSKWQIRQGITPKISNEWEDYKPLIQAKWGEFLK